MVSNQFFFSQILGEAIKFFLQNEMFASTRKGIIKELCGIYKVFLLLDEYEDPTF